MFRSPRQDDTLFNGEDSLLIFFLSFFTLSYLPLQYYCCNSILSSYYWHQCDKRIHFWRRALFIYLYLFLHYIFLTIINNIFIYFRRIIYIVLTEEYTFFDEGDTVSIFFLFLHCIFFSIVTTDFTIMYHTYLTIFLLSL